MQFGVCSIVWLHLLPTSRVSSQTLKSANICKRSKFDNILLPPASFNLFFAAVYRRDYIEDPVSLVVCFPVTALET